MEIREILYQGKKVGKIKVFLIMPYVFYILFINNLFFKLIYLQALFIAIWNDKKLNKQTDMYTCIHSKTSKTIVLGLKIKFNSSIFYFSVTLLDCINKNQDLISQSEKYRHCFCLKSVKFCQFSSSSLQHLSASHF